MKQVGNGLFLHFKTTAGSKLFITDQNMFCDPTFTSDPSSCILNFSTNETELDKHLQNMLDGRLFLHVPEHIYPD